MDIEIRDVPGFPFYEVDGNGDVWRKAGTPRCKVRRKLTPGISSNGYLLVALSSGSKVRSMMVHKVVASAFIGPRPDGMEVCHINGSRLNNRPSNLRYDTRKGNMADQIRDGKTPRGTKSGSNKYDKELVRGVRTARALGNTYEQISRIYGIPVTTVTGMITRKTWAWLDE